MTYPIHPPSERGSAIVLTLLLLVVLTIFGISSITTSDIDLKVASGERDYIKDFFVAESAWKEAGIWLDTQSTIPRELNTDADNIVRNYGDGDTDETNAGFGEGTEDGTSSDDNIPYWYKLAYMSDTAAGGNGKDARRFWYQATANADRAQQIEVQLTNIFKVGY